MTSVGWLVLLPPGVGWDIMGYESDPLPSYPELRNCSYSVKLITPLPRLILWLIYHILIPSAHHPARPHHYLRLRAHFIYSLVGHPLRYTSLPPIYLYSDGMDPCGVHHLLYHWILPLSACPTFFHHLRDPSYRSMVECGQDLEHLSGHHPSLASV